MPPVSVRVIACALLLASVAFPSDAETQATDGELSPDASISLVTILPGEPVHTFAGHSALHVRDPRQNIDRLYNYGTFDFSDPMFIPKFLYGDLRYFLSVTPYDSALRVYRRQGRPVIEQRLNLTPQQQDALFRFLRNNARPENRYYQYDFFFDNCSTRIRDALASALDGSVSFADAPAPDASFRQMLDPYVATRPGIDLGFDLALGLPADRTPTAREAMFLPKRLLIAFNSATVSVNGVRRPLVTRTDTTQWIEGYEQMDPGSGWPSLLAWCFFGLVVLWTGAQAVVGRAPGAWGDAILFATVGTAGLAICFLWFGSTYTVTNDNLNLLWAWPTHLLAARWLIRRPTSNGLRYYLAATALTAIVLAVGWSAWPQQFHEATRPVVLAVAVRSAWWAVLTSSQRFILS